MGYNPYSDLYEIYKRKQNWTNSNNAGDNEGKTRAAEEAKKYYASLSANGYGDLSSEMSNAGLYRAKQLVAQYGMSGKSPVREYYYTLGQSRGMSKKDIDNLIGWNNATGEITFGGKNVGKPDSVIDGVSYIGDTKILDDSFNDYINRAGVTLDSGVNNPAYNSAMKGASDKNAKYNEAIHSDRDTYMNFVKDLLGYANQDVTKTDEYKSAFENIMPSYNVKAMQGRDNVVASGAGSNGGNIDSFSAANAARQQQAITAKGQELAHQMGLDSYNSRVQNVANILEKMGIYLNSTYPYMSDSVNNDMKVADTHFNNAEAAKKNDVDIKKTISDVTGYSPDEWVVSNNPYLNDDGTLKEQYKNLDFAAIMQNAKEAGDDRAYKAAAVARFYKIMGDYGAYGQYDNGDYAIPDRQITEGARQFNEQIAQADRALGAEKEMNAANNQNKLDQINLEGQYSGTKKPRLTAAQAAQAIKDGNITQDVIDAYNYYYGSNYTAEDFLNSPSDKDKWAGVDAWVEAYGENSAEDYIKEHYKELGFDNVKVALSGYKNYKTQKTNEVNNKTEIDDDRKTLSLIKSMKNKGWSRDQIEQVYEQSYKNGEISESEYNKAKNLIARAF